MSWRGSTTSLLIDSLIDNYKIARNFLLISVMVFVNCPLNISAISLDLVSLSAILLLTVLINFSCENAISRCLPVIDFDFILP